MSAAPISKYIRGTIKVVAWVVLFLVAGIAVLLGSLWLDHNSTFFDVYLKGAPASELNSRSNDPEIEYVH